MKKTSIFIYSIIVFLLLFQSCEEHGLTETDLERGSSTKRGNAPDLITASLSELKNDVAFVRCLSKLVGKSDVASAAKYMEKNNGFTIDTSRIVKIFENGRTSYTMKVNRGEAWGDEFENLVTEVDSLGNVKTTLITYKLISYDYKTGAIRYIGPIKATPVSAMGLASKEACVLLRIWYCDWGGDVHYAGANCTPGYMWEETLWFC